MGTAQDAIKATQVLEYSYGEFLLRKANGPECRYLYAFENSAYRDVQRIIKEKFVTDGFEPTDLLQIAFGPAVCDAEPDGEPLEMNLWPYCPNCRAAEPSSWQMTEPLEFVDIEIPLTEHKLWNSFLVNLVSPSELGRLRYANPPYVI